jgi:drug/metabolite transporter (DMT)-like permease
MVRQRQADLLLVAATVIAACGWIFSREAIAGMPVFAFLGLRFFCGAAAAVLSRLSRRIVIATSLRFGLQMKG